MKNPDETTCLIEGEERQVGKDVNAERKPDVTKGVALALLHIVCSGSLIVFNRYALQPERFPFPCTLTTLHMLVGFLCSLAIFKVCPKLFPSACSLEFNSTKLELQVNGMIVNPFEFVGIGVLYAMSVVTAMIAYKFATASFLQMVKEMVVVWAYLMSVLFGLERFVLGNFLLMAVLVPCAAMTISGSTQHFAWTGMMLQLQSSMAQATVTVWTSRLMLSRGGAKFDPMTMVMLTAPIAFVALLPVNRAFWHESIPEHIVSCWGMLVLSCGGAFCVQVVNTFAIRELSACGLAMVAVLKDLVLVVGMALIMSQGIATVQVAGFVGSITIMALYAMMKLQTSWEGSQAGTGQP